MADYKIPYAKKEIYDRSDQITYRGRNLDEIAFPLGGIGTGMVSLGGWGQLRDWEIMNHPDKGRGLKDVFFSLRCRFKSGRTVAKVLQGPVGGSFVGDGHTLAREAGEGLPHFAEASFTGNFPLATVVLRDPDMPVQATLEAFNPFIPLNDKDSSIPAAILTYHVENTSKEDLELLLCGNLSNIVGEENSETRSNEARKEKSLTGLFLSDPGVPADSPKHGSLALAALSPDVSVWTRWKIGTRNARFVKFWQIMSEDGEFPPKVENPMGNTGSVAVPIKLKGGESAAVTFLISWHFPNFEHWKKEPAGGSCEEEGCCGEPRGKIWKNYYASVWKDAWDVAAYVAGNFQRLSRETRLFKDTLFASTLPSYVLDAVSSQISILKTPTCLRLTDGTFYGFEGCSNTSGCCEGSCTHVWNYAQALPYLFPNLQRSVAEAHFANSMMDDGFVQFRMPLPLGTKAQPTFLPCGDGQMGSVMQIYREWLISGDQAWLRKVWPDTKKMLEFAWKYWDADKDGVMEGMQHNTYDIEFHGPNTMMGSLYLGALRVGEELARKMGETDKAEEYRSLFEKGSAWTDESLFNGEYYEQQVKVGMEEPWPEKLREWALRRGRDDKFTDWPLWQYGKGCISDQLIGQWYGRMLGLGDLYKPENITKALKSIFRYNWRADLSDHPCFFRIYAVNQDAGLLIGTWPKGERPGYGFYFADEVWCGIEYQVASHMIYEGLLEEGLAIVLGLRRRYRGDRRNPWDEFECGHHYSRSMASYSLLLALSGFRYAASEGIIRIEPRIFEDDHRCFFSVESGWGLIGQKRDKKKVELSVEMRYGSLSLRRFQAPKAGEGRSAGEVKADLAGKAISCGWSPEDAAVIFDQECRVNAGERLSIIL